MACPPGELRARLGGSGPGSGCPEPTIRRDDSEPTPVLRVRPHLKIPNQGPSQRVPPPIFKLLPLHKSRRESWRETLRSFSNIAVRSVSLPSVRNLVLRLFRHSMLRVSAPYTSKTGQHHAKCPSATLPITCRPDTSSAWPNVS